MIDIKIIADEADMIVNGYAFKRCKEGYRVLNLNRPDRATVLSLDGKCWKQVWMILKFVL